MTRYLVTGAQGLVGRYLSARLLASAPSASVLGIGRSPRLDGSFSHTLPAVGLRHAPLPPALADALRSGFEYEALDVLDGDRLRALLSAHRPDVVFHLAAGLRYADQAHILHTNIVGTASLVEAIASLPRPRPRVVIGSSGGVYGRLRPEQLPVRESAPCEPMDVYGVSKLAAEQVARLIAREHGVELAVARVFNVCGPGQDEHHVCGRIAAQLAAGAPELRLGSLHTTRDFIDVRDVAAALMCIAENGAPGAAYNVASGVETSIESLLARMVRLAGWVGTTRSADPGARTSDVLRHAGDIARLRGIGYAPRHSLDDSLRDLLAYLRAVIDADGAAPLDLRAARVGTDG